LTFLLSVNVRRGGGEYMCVQFLYGTQFLALRLCVHGVVGRDSTANPACLL